MQVLIDKLAVGCKLLGNFARKESPMSELDSHYRNITRSLMEGTLVPFLGAGANLCGRPKDTAWRQRHYLPSGAELAAFLANTYDYPTQEVKLSCPACHAEVVGTQGTPDLLRVSQFVDVIAGGLGDLYRELHRVFDADYPATALHQF